MSKTGAGVSRRSCSSWLSSASFSAGTAEVIKRSVNFGRPRRLLTGAAGLGAGGILRCFLARSMNPILCSASSSFV